MRQMSTLEMLFYLFGGMGFLFQILFALVLKGYFVKRKYMKWWKPFMHEDYFYFLRKYRELTREENGRIGPGYYLFFVAAFFYLGFITLGIARLFY